MPAISGSNSCTAKWNSRQVSSTNCCPQHAQVLVPVLHTQMVDVKTNGGGSSRAWQQRLTYAQIKCRPPHLSASRFVRIAPPVREYKLGVQHTSSTPQQMLVCDHTPVCTQQPVRQLAVKHLLCSRCTDVYSRTCRRDALRALLR